MFIAPSSAHGYVFIRTLVLIAFMVLANELSALKNHQHVIDSTCSAV